jgi:hypothetical protein
MAAASVLAFCLTPSAQAGQTDNLFTIESAATPAELAAGEKGTVRLGIKVKSEGHIDPQAPFKAVLTAKGLKLEKEKLGRKDAVHQADGASFEVPFVAEVKGEDSVDAELSFYICVKQICEHQKRNVSVPVKVK